MVTTLIMVNTSNIYSYWITMLYTWNQYNIVYELYFDKNFESSAGQKRITPWKKETTGDSSLA